MCQVVTVGKAQFLTEVIVDGYVGNMKMLCR